MVFCINLLYLIDHGPSIVLSKCDNAILWMRIFTVGVALTHYVCALSAQAAYMKRNSYVL